MAPFLLRPRPSTPRVPFQAGIEEFLWVLDGGSPRESELHNLLVRFPGADDAVMGPDRRSHRFPLLLNVGVGIVDELPDIAKGLRLEIFAEAASPFG